VKIYLEVLTRIGWVVVALAIVAPFVLGHVGGDNALLRFLRSRCDPVLPIDRAQLRAEMRIGVRVTLYLVAPVLIYGAYAVGGSKWWLVVILCGVIMVPMVTIPMSIAHTVLLRLLAFHGPVVSIALGLVIGSLAGNFVRDQDASLATAFVFYGGVYGLFIGIAHMSLAAPSIVRENVTDTPQEQPFW
jgi:hypothetical protein